MAKTMHHVDIDLTTVPAQRVSSDDAIQIVHREVAAAPAAMPTRAAHRMWAAVAALAAAAGFGVGVPAGLLLSSSPSQTAPAPARNDIDRLLLDPLGSQPPQPVAPTDQQDLVNRLLNPGPG